MAKNIIEKAPFIFSYSLYNIDENISYLDKYKEVNVKGNYLYWDEFKYRIDKKDDKLIAWWATKLARFFKMKRLNYKDKNNKKFTFCIPDNLQAKLYRISKNSLQGIVPNNSIKREYLISSLIMEESISSAQLEGASPTRRVAKEMLSSGRKPKTNDEMMILNNYFLMQEVKITKTQDLSRDMILNYHKIATRENTENGNIAGKFRTNNEIVVTDGFDTVVHTPPCFSNIEDRLYDICDFANSKHLGENGDIFIDPIIKAIILHFMIAYEHPFPDGNGRTARAIFYWFMLKSGFDYFEYISISKLLKNAPVKYGKSFLYSEIDDNDLTYFIYYQTDIMIRAIEELLDYLEKKSVEFEEVTMLLSSSKIGRTLNFVQKDIVKKSIKEAGRIFMVKEIASDYDIVENTARTYLKKLVEYKILIAYKKGRSVGYIAPSNLREVFKN